MIILKIHEEEKNYERRSKRFKRRRIKEPIFNYSRAGIIINNKPHFVISVSQSMLGDLEFQKLLNKYKGSIIVPEKLEEEPFFDGLLFDKIPFLKKAIFESFKNILLSENFKDANIWIKDFDFVLKHEIPTILPLVKSIALSIDANQNLRMWQEFCYNEYGVKPKVYNEERSDFLNFDIIADFEKINNNALEIVVYDEIKKIYPNLKYLKIPDNLRVLEEFEISKSMICAAFNDN